MRETFRKHTAWWVLLALQTVAWGPFLVDEVVHRLRGMNYSPDEETALMYGFWLFVWWPLMIASAGVLAYILFSFVLGFFIKE